MSDSLATAADRVVTVPGGMFLMGSESFYADEGPVHEVTVASFELDVHPVTNAQFARFVDETGYVTVAQRPLAAEDYPGVDRADLVPGGLVFTGSRGPVDLSDWRQWWSWAPGADWRHPFGPGSSIEGRERHPVVQVSFEDASAYAAWTGKRLPTEAEWEFAARAGAPAEWPYAWGAEPRVDGALMANTWQGRFPYLNTGADGWIGTSPVGSFQPNANGLVDMIGNVWEWTSTYYAPRHDVPVGRVLGLTDVSVANAANAATSATDATGEAALAASGSCGDGCACGPDAASLARTGVDEQQARARSAEPGSAIPRRALKGGSHLCAPEYCLRYRPAARSPQADDSATTHIGFRCARSL
ncbi:formylglycine-generating enzyme family protein [Rathayibacter soli]|uniref:formylglycine-generating enzyme family protein n=1 Tax=Rathayibacter soli TaxID=3144168 RepID=UPI0027E5924E|nr:formylglycine-generating enzyme family protein [Glaciibacter superstes]